MRSFATFLTHLARLVKQKRLACESRYTPSGVRTFPANGGYSVLEGVHRGVHRIAQKRGAADHYVYALTDYREVNRSAALLRAMQNR